MIMMRFHIYLLQKKPETGYQQAMNEYLKRLQSYANVSVQYIKNEKQARKLFRSGERNFIVTAGKKSMTSPKFSELIQRASIQGESSLNFYIGRFEENMEEFHISSFSLNTSLTGVVLLEQIYRAYRILNHQPYHK